MTGHKLTLAVAAGAMVLAATPAFGQAGAGFLSQHRDWYTYKVQEGQSLTCFAVSRAQKMEPSNVRHGDVLIYVTNRPAEQVRGAVNVSFEFHLREGSSPTISVGGQSFAAFVNNVIRRDGNPQGEIWTRDETVDRELSGAMRAGSELQVEATSTRGTNVSYSFSLLGISAALDEINGACGG